MNNKIRCTILKEKDKAFMLKVLADEHGLLVGKVIWLPKTDIRLAQPEVSIFVPNWLYESKLAE
jgi:hypothetical protein